MISKHIQQNQKVFFNSFAITFQSWSLLIIYISPSQDLNKAIITLLSSSLCGGWLWAGSSCAALPQWHPKQKYITLFIISLKKKQKKKRIAALNRRQLHCRTKLHLIKSFNSNLQIVFLAPTSISYEWISPLCVRKSDSNLK